jgi:hypothetical protein
MARPPRRLKAPGHKPAIAAGGRPPCSRHRRPCPGAAGAGAGPRVARAGSPGAAGGQAAAAPAPGAGEPPGARAGGGDVALGEACTRGRTPAPGVMPGGPGARRGARRPAAPFRRDGSPAPGGGELTGRLPAGARAESAAHRPPGPGGTLPPAAASAALRPGRPASEDWHRGFTGAPGYDIRPGDTDLNPQGNRPEPPIGATPTDRGLPAANRQPALRAVHPLPGVLDLRHAKWPIT